MGRGVRIEEGPVHGEIPEGAVDGIDGGAEYEERFEAAGLIDAVERERHVIEDGKGVFAAVDEVWKDVAGVIVPTEALQGSPDAREAGEEAEKTRVRGVALWGVGPVIGVEAEEELEIAHGVGEGAEHVAQEEVAELDGVDACEQETPLWGTVNSGY